MKLFDFVTLTSIFLLDEVLSQQCPTHFDLLYGGFEGNDFWTLQYETCSENSLVAVTISYPIGLDGCTQYQDDCTPPLTWSLSSEFYVPFNEECYGPDVGPFDGRLFYGDETGVYLQQYDFRFWEDGCYELADYEELNDCGPAGYATACTDYAVFYAVTNVTVQDPFGVCNLVATGASLDGNYNVVDSYEGFPVYHGVSTNLLLFYYPEFYGGVWWFTDLSFTNIIAFCLYTIQYTPNFCPMWFVWNDEIEDFEQVSDFTLECATSTDASCNVADMDWIGDGWCDWIDPEYNTEECEWDGGDCCPQSCRYTPGSPCGVGSYDCQDPAYTAPPCGLDPTVVYGHDGYLADTINGEYLFQEQDTFTYFEHLGNDNVILVGIFNETVPGGRSETFWVFVVFTEDGHDVVGGGIDSSYWPHDVSLWSVWNEEGQLQLDMGIAVACSGGPASVDCAEVTGYVLYPNRGQLISDDQCDADTTDLTVCSEICNLDSSCEAFDWVAEYGCCWWAEPMNDLRSMPGVCSYIQDCPEFDGYTVYSQMSENGGECQYESDLDICAEICNERPGCEAFDWHPEFGCCWWEEPMTDLISALGTCSYIEEPAPVTESCCTAASQIECSFTTAVCCEDGSWECPKIFGQCEEGQICSNFEGSSQDSSDESSQLQTEDETSDSAPVPAPTSVLL